jgi:16S rRNA (cytidine1402-2'-O)-methyltransferase
MPTSEQSSAGWLALVATPIGNLEDITQRALAVLRDCDVVAAEDTRRARKLLNRYEIPVSVTSYHAHNERARTSDLLRQVREGRRVAVLSDAGTPSVSDPGYLLVRDAIAAGIEPRVIPGACALTYAVVAAGFPVTQFTFAGFLPPKGQKRRTQLTALADASPTVFLFESPYRIGKLLDDIVAAVGAETRVALLREATKLHEEHIRGTAGMLAERYREKKWKGEFTVAFTTVPDRSVDAGDDA